MKNSATRIEELTQIGLDQIETIAKLRRALRQAEAIVLENGMVLVIANFKNEEEAEQAGGYGKAFRACYDYLEDHGQLPQDKEEA